MSSKRIIHREGVSFQEVSPSFWEDIADMQNEKSLIEKRILLPLLHLKLAKKHGVILPKAILLYGPPGTGKTIFAKGIAGRLGWTFVEVSPSDLIAISLDTEARQLKSLFGDLMKLKRAVIFFDEFEELALRPEKAAKSERMVSSEMLKQIPRLRESEEVLLVTATNNIRLLNPALLRPGRFDFILPIGPPDLVARKQIFKKFLEPLNLGEVDIDAIAEKAKNYTPADIRAICSDIAQFTFEQELLSGKEYKARTEDFLKLIEHYKPTISEKDVEQFKKDIVDFCRADYCRIFF